MATDREEQEDELLALHSILGSEEFVRNESNLAGEIRVSVLVPAGFTVALTEGETVRQYELSFLPPLLLTFDLPDDYPSSSPPSFTLTCSWLTHSQLSALDSHLTNLYQATGGTVVLFSWVQFLKEDAMKYLDIHTLLELPSDEHDTQNHGQDSQTNAQSKTHKSQCNSAYTHDQSSDDLGPSSSSDNLNQHGQGAASPPVNPRESFHNGLSLTPSQTLLSQLLIYNAAQKQKAFATTVFDCGVCFVAWLGSECVQVPECGHMSCRACLAEFCRVQITEGNVRGVTCPQTDCTAALTPAQVKDLVGEELFLRYDRLLLQSTLDHMPDVLYCPRRSCGSPVIFEQSSTAALCSVCSFAFCVTCRKTYHGPGGCEDKTSMKKLQETDLQQAHVDLPQSQDGMRALSDDYTSGSKVRRRLLQSRYGRRVMQYILPDILSEDWMALNVKTCPHCFCRIQKNGGCNHMMCSRCHQRFCWACLTRLPGVGGNSHFLNTPCSSYGENPT